MKRMVAWTGLALLVLAGLWCWALMLRPAWIEPIEGVRLEPARPILRESDVRPDSAYDLFRRAIDLPPFDTKGVEDEWKQMQKTGWRENYTNLASAISLCVSNIDLARRAALAPDPQVPSATNFSMVLPNLGKARDVARLLQADAYRQSAMGDGWGAASNLMAGIRFGNILSRGGCVIHRLVGDAICNLELEAIRLLAARDDWPHALLRSLIRELADIEAQGEPYAECLRYEYIGIRSIVDVVYAGDTDAWLDYGITGGGSGNHALALAIQIGAPLLGSTRGETHRNLRYTYGHLIVLAETNYDEAAYEYLFDRAILGNTKSLILHRDPVGHLFANILVSNYDHIHAGHLSCIAHLRATRLALALQLHADETGALPETLEALAPRYLDAVPADPFDGRLLRYRRLDDTTWRLYSVGRNGRDDGGTGDANTPHEGLDLVFESE